MRQPVTDGRLNTPSLLTVSMGVSVTLRVQMPDGTAVSGAKIDGTNTNAWMDTNKKWPGTTRSDGSYTWSNLDKGTLGNFYTFEVTYTDPNGTEWAGKVSDRITGPRTLVVTLHKA